MKKLMLTIVLSLTLPIYAQENKDDKPSLSEMMSREFATFLVEYNLRTMHFNKNPKTNELKKAYLQEIDYEKGLLTEPQISKLKLDVLLLNVQKNMFGIASATKKEIDSNLIKLIEKIKNQQITFNDLDKPFTLNFDRKTKTHPKDYKELETYWVDSLKYISISDYLKKLKDNEMKELKLTDKEKDNYVLKEFKKDPLILSEVVDEAKRNMLNNFNRVVNKNINDYSTIVLNSLTTIYDRHSSYIAPKDEESFNSDLNGSMEGIGAVLKEVSGEIVVDSIVPGGAAWHSNKINDGDVFVSVTDHSTKKTINLKGMSVDDAVKHIKGSKGSKITIKVKKAKEDADNAESKSSDKKNDVAKSDNLIDVELSRVSIELASTYVKYSLIQKGEDKYGYIYVPKFYRDFQNPNNRNCSRDVEIALTNLKKHNIKGVILDLRNNGGGALLDSQLMTGLFIKEGPVVSVKSSDGDKDVYSDKDPSVTYDGSLVVLVNKFSASASEIVAAALQDYKRAIIIGSEQTHGKGTVQSIINFSKNSFPLFNYFRNIADNLGTIKLTTQKFYRISGETTQFNGVVPDIIIPEMVDFDHTLERVGDFALEPDKIEPEVYSTYMDDKVVKSVAKASQKRIDSNPLFNNIKAIRKFNDENSSKIKTNVTLDSQYKKELDVNEKIGSLKKEINNFKEDYKITTTLDVFYPNMKNNFDDPRLTKIAEKEIGKYEDFLKNDLTISESIKVLKDLSQVNYPTTVKD